MPGVAGGAPPALAALLAPLLLLAGVIALFVLAREARGRAGGPLGVLVVVLVGAASFAAISWATLWLLAVTAGFYESLTCKIVSIPGCEAPLALPAWLALPQQSAGGVLGVLPLAAVYLLKVTQRAHPPLHLPEDTPFGQRLGRLALHALVANAGLIFAVVVELWLAALRGQAEAADRQVRLALGLDADLPDAYFAVARWGAVVLALGLSAAVLALGVAGRAARVLTTDALARLHWGADLVDLLGTALLGIAQALRALARQLATALGWAALTLAAALRALWRAAAGAVGGGLLALWAAGRWLLTVLALALGRPIVALGRWMGRLAGRARRGDAGARVVPLAPLLALLWLAPAAEAATWVVLVDATGSEATRLADTNRQILGWADPDPNRALLERGDRLVVVPVRAPGRLDPTYPVAFSAVYPDDQLGRYAFFRELRDALPAAVDAEPGTDLSASLRVAAAQLERFAAAGEARTLLVFGNGEDHADAVTAAELAPGLSGARVAHLALGEAEWARWERLYREAGATTVALFDLAAARSLDAAALQAALTR